MAKDIVHSDLARVLSSRGEFLEADMRLGAMLQELLGNAVTPEECLLALVDQQRAYERYMREVLDTVQLRRKAGA